MGIFEVAVVFVITWWLFFLPSLSAGAQSQAETGQVVPGSEPGAPTQWKVGRKVLIATLGALGLTALMWVSITFGLLDGLVPASA